MNDRITNLILVTSPSLQLRDEILHRSRFFIVLPALIILANARCYLRFLAFVPERNAYSPSKLK